MKGGLILELLALCGDVFIVRRVVKPLRTLLMFPSGTGMTRSRVKSTVPPIDHRSFNWIGDAVGCGRPSSKRPPP